MPLEIKSKEDFQKLAEKAIEVRVTRNGDSAKLKLRTPKVLYTFKTSGAEVEELTKGLKAEVVEY
ncbi:MAG: hypothetical protein LYZ66_04725 [Nitrososphaerales archaeon]|nr:hypothetical protein [Nitrososphaerales archaeon]